MLKSLNRIIQKIGIKTLYYLFIVVNLIPSLFLVFTEPYNIPGKAALLLLPIGVLLILLSLFKRVGLAKLLLLPLFFFHAFQLVVFSLFKEDVIAVDMFLNLTTTNVSEANELLSSILVPTILACLIYILTIVLVIVEFRAKLYYEKDFLKKNLIVGVILSIVSFSLFPISKDYNTEEFDMHTNMYPFNVLYNMGFAINKMGRIKEYPNTSEAFVFNAKRNLEENENDVYVLVIGETSRADNWGLYGYERNTTPNLSTDSTLVVFRDALTQSNTTHKSVSIILSPASAENYDQIYSQKGILTAFEEAGFETVFLSNQARNHSFIEYFGDEAHHTEYFRDTESIVDQKDDILLDRIKYYIETTDKPTFIVVHTYGSHFNYGERYPRSFAQFMPDNFSAIEVASRDNMVNAYDNSILYTDYILHEIKTLLENSNRKSAMLYLSDHGEDIMDDSRHRFLHASPNPTYYQLRIPFITWFSPEYIEQNQTKYDLVSENKNNPVSSSVVFHTLLDIADIETPFLEKQLSVASPEFSIQQRMYLGDHDEPIHYTKTNLKEEDKVMLVKNRISEY